MEDFRGEGVRDGGFEGCGRGKMEDVRGEAGKMEEGRDGGSEAGRDKMEDVRQGEVRWRR